MSGRVSWTSRTTGRRYVVDLRRRPWPDPQAMTEDAKLSMPQHIYDMLQDAADDAEDSATRPRKARRPPQRK